MVEGARLESVYTGNRIVGSNPTPSANKKGTLWGSFFIGASGEAGGPPFEPEPASLRGRGPRAPNQNNKRPPVIPLLRRIGGLGTRRERIVQSLGMGGARA